MSAPNTVDDAGLTGLLGRFYEQVKDAMGV